MVPNISRQEDRLGTEVRVGNWLTESCQTLRSFDAMLHVLDPLEKESLTALCVFVASGGGEGAKKPNVSARMLQLGLVEHGPGGGLVPTEAGYEVARGITAEREGNIASLTAEENRWLAQLLPGGRLAVTAVPGLGVSDAQMPEKIRKRLLDLTLVTSDGQGLRLTPVGERVALVQRNNRG
jgi:hypothetical protein